MLPTAVALSAIALPGQLQTMSMAKIADGVYGAIYSEMHDDPVHSNSLIVIGDDGVAVVDADYTPAGARATIAEIRKLTKLPVRYVITTHWHDDHVFGNQESQIAFPGVEFVAHRRTRESMVAGLLQHQQELAKHYGETLGQDRDATGQRCRW